jgi:hypothetical protein
VRELFIDRLSPAELAVLRDALARRPPRTPTVIGTLRVEALTRSSSIEARYYSMEKGK